MGLPGLQYRYGLPKLCAQDFGALATAAVLHIHTTRGPLAFLSAKLVLPSLSIGHSNGWCPELEREWHELLWERWPRLCALCRQSSETRDPKHLVAKPQKHYAVRLVQECVQSYWSDPHGSKAKATGVLATACGRPALGSACALQLDLQIARELVVQAGRHRVASNTCSSRVLWDRYAFRNGWLQVRHLLVVSYHQDIALCLSESY